MSKPVSSVLSVLVYFDDIDDDVELAPYLVSGSIERGRSRWLDEFRAGRATLTFENPGRRLDPPFTGADPGEWGVIRPGQRARVFYDGVQVFEGHGRWSHSWDSAPWPTATLTASDCLERFAAARFAEWTPVSGQRVGPRLASALARPEVDWDGTTDFDAGEMTLQAALVAAGTNVLGYLQLLARTTGGRFFASRTNVPTFRQVTRASFGSVSLTFADDDSANDFFGISTSDGAEEWFTEVTCQRLGGLPQTSTSASGIRDLHGGGVRQMQPRTGLLMKTDAGALNLAQYLRARHEQLVGRVSALRVNLSAIANAAATAAAGAEIADLLELDPWTPNGEGDPLDPQVGAIEGIRDRFDQTKWDRTFTLSGEVGIPGWVIGTSTIGTGVLGL